MLFVFGLDGDVGVVLSIWGDEGSVCSRGDGCGCSAGVNGDGCYIGRGRGRWWSDVERDERMREGKGKERRFCSADAEGYWRLGRTF